MECRTSTQTVLRMLRSPSFRLVAWSVGKAMYELASRDARAGPPPRREPDGPTSPERGAWYLREVLKVARRLRITGTADDLKHLARVSQIARDELNSLLEHAARRTLAA